jgi:hypothetical protein
MGYRNPLTTAAAVDTSNGRTGVPAARLLQRQISPGVFQGVVQVDDGVTVAEWTLTGGGFADNGGAVMQLAGPASVQGVPGPRLQLNVAQNADGSYSPEARLKGAGLIVEQPGTRLQGLAPLVGAGGLITSVSTNGSGEATITHGLGVAPAAFLVAPANGGPIPNLVDFVVVAYTTTTATVRAIRRDNNTVFAGNPVSFVWVALLPTP